MDPECVVKEKCSLAFLSWRAPATLSATLEALFHVLGAGDFHRAYVFFQDIQKEDRELAALYGLEAYGNESNKGIREGIKQAISMADSPFVLFLENDCRLMAGVSAGDVLQAIAGGITDMESWGIPVMRFRNRFHPGRDYDGARKFLKYWPENPEEDTLYLKIRRLIRWEKAVRLAGQAVYVDREPENRFMRPWVTRLPSGNFKVSSKVIPWTNQSILVNREHFNKVILPYAEAHPTSRTVNGFPDLEKELNCRWWRKQCFPIAISDPGLFSHERIDRPKEDEKLGVPG